VVEYRRRVTLNVMSDSYISEANPDTNCGSVPQVYAARHAATFQERHLVPF